MATYAENLTTARNALALALATGAAKPNYVIDGQSVSWGELCDRIKKLDEAIAVANGPWEIVTEGMP